MLFVQITDAVCWIVWLNSLQLRWGKPRDPFIFSLSSSLNDYQLPGATQLHVRSLLHGLQDIPALQPPGISIGKD